MTKEAKIQELLSALYLRLNGYWVTNLIIHSDSQGNHRTELDIIAVRFPLHSQVDRQVETSKYLEVDSKRTEILLADVKGGKELSFNKSLRKERASIEKLLRWIGIFSEEELKANFDNIEYHLNDIHTNRKNRFRNIDLHLEAGKFRIKMTFFAFNRAMSTDNDLKYVHEQEILSYCWKCLQIIAPVNTCSPQYDYTHWKHFEPIVRYLKSLDAVPEGMQGLYDKVY